MIQKIIKKSVAVALALAMGATLAVGVPAEKALAENTAQENTALTPVAENCMQKIYENLMKEGSSFSKQKKEIQEMFGDLITCDASIDGNTITITVVGKDDYEESSGSWNYVLEGNYLTYTAAGTDADISGRAYFTYLEDAAADYLGMDGDLLNGYIRGVDWKNLTSDYYIIEKDANNEVSKIKLYVGAAFSMDDVLNSVYLDEEVLEYEDALNDEQYISGVAKIGKVGMWYSGKRSSVEIYIFEHGNLTDLAYKSILSVVGKMQPVGYETFLENYKELSEVSTETYQVSYVKDASELPEGFQDSEHYSFIKLHFFAPSLSATSLSLKAGEFDFLMADECEVKSWKSSNKKVAIVEDGNITALKKGTTTITATLTDGKKLTCKVKVTSNPKITIGGKAYKKNKTYTVKKKKSLKVNISGKAFSVDTSCKSSKKSVTKVSKKGVGEKMTIKGVKKGTAKITITVNGVKFVFKVKVKA